MVFLLIVSLAGEIHEIVFAAEDQNFSGAVRLWRWKDLDLKSVRGSFSSELYRNRILVVLLQIFFNAFFDCIETV